MASPIFGPIDELVRERLPFWYVDQRAFAKLSTLDRRCPSNNTLWIDGHCLNGESESGGVFRAQLRQLSQQSTSPVWRPIQPGVEDSMMKVLIPSFSIRQFA